VLELIGDCIDLQRRIEEGEDCKNYGPADPICKRRRRSSHAEFPRLGIGEGVI